MVIIERNTKDNKEIIYSDVEVIAKKYHRSIDTIQKCIDEGSPLYNKYFDVIENAFLYWGNKRTEAKK